MQVKRHFNESATDGGVFDTTLRLSSKETHYISIALQHYLKELSEDTEYFAEDIQAINQMIQDI